MAGLSELRDLEGQLSTRSRAECEESIERFEIAVELLLEAWSVLSGHQFSVRPAKEASRLLSWRFTSTIPGTACWCIEAAIKGQYGVAGCLLRLLMEETVSLLYYAKFPEAALRHVVGSPGKDAEDFDGKLDALGLPNGHSIRRLYGELSNLYSHGNALLRSELVTETPDGNRTLYAGPSFRRDAMEFIAISATRLLATSLSALALDPFPELFEAPGDWSGRMSSFVDRLATALGGDPAEGS